jgi:hypothetical protein
MADAAERETDREREIEKERERERGDEPRCFRRDSKVFRRDDGSNEE